MDRRLFITTIAGFTLGVMALGTSCASKEEENKDSGRKKEEAVAEVAAKKIEAGSGAVTKTIRDENISGAVTRTKSASGAVTTAK